MTTGILSGRGFLRPALAILFIVLLALVPAFSSGFTVSLFNDAGIATLVVLGLVLLSGIGGVTSFGQAAFVGIAAYASAWLNTRYGFSPWAGLAFALAVTTLCAAVIGLLTLRLGGHYLPLSTIAWGLSVPLLFGNIEALGSHSGIADIAPISLFGATLGTPQSVFYPIWITVIAAAAYSYLLLNSRMGRLIRAVRGGEVLLASFGADIFRVRLALFILSAVFAALAGWFYAHAYRFISPAPFSLHQSIIYMLMMVTGGLGQLAGAFIGAGLITAVTSKLQDLLPYVTDHAAQLQSVVFAAVFILLLQYARGGVGGMLVRLVGRGHRTHEPDNSPADAGAGTLPQRTLPTRGTVLLRVTDASRYFRGLVAVNKVGFEVRAGEIVGLIGPNGAGKSTMFNLLTGTLPLSAGQVEFMGKDITRLKQREIARMGMARTFQHVKLRPSMSILDNVALGAHARGKNGYLGGGLGLGGQEERRLLAEARRQIARIGLKGRESELAGSVSLGTQRMIEIARALASDPCLLVLDEPAAGLRKPEKKVLADLLDRLRQEGVTILIVEHDMDFVMKLVDRLVVLNFGTRLFDGAPQDARLDKGVRAAYLGEAA